MEKKECIKCGKELPDDSNDKIKLCEECHEKKKSIIKKILIGSAVAVGTASLAAVLAALANKNRRESNDTIDDDAYEYNDDDDVDDDNDSEKISVWDAAEIYLSSGFDEDYSFGYSHEELIDALKD